MSVFELIKDMSYLANIAPVDRELPQQFYHPWPVNMKRDESNAHSHCQHLMLSAPETILHQPPPVVAGSASFLTSPTGPDRQVSVDPRDVADPHTARQSQLSPLRRCRSQYQGPASNAVIDAAGIVFYPNFYRWFDQGTHEPSEPSVTRWASMLADGSLPSCW